MSSAISPLLALPLSTLSEDAVVNILSRLAIGDLCAVARTSKLFNTLAQDPRIWKAKVMAEFGERLSEDLKRPDKEWKAIYKELAESKKNRMDNIGDVISTHAKKVVSADITHRTNAAAARIFGLTAPPGTIQVPEQRGTLAGRKITYKRPNQL
ncbi:hypothetical protein PHSC3_000413 [Chlamydiales bacterium STE3]|nr:hypothetical protein PHSC3_000413 [Chlamydiales bacterium STE3]